METHQKSDLRLVMKDRRSALFQKYPEAGEKIAPLFFDAFPFPLHTRLGAYWPVGSELDIRPLLRELVKRGFRCALPCMIPLGIVFREWDPAVALSEGKFQLFEPPSTAPLLIPDVLLVPLLAFDRQGHRLGYGQGYYDQYLSHHKVLTIGVGFKEQEIEEVPHQDHDVSLDYILTEAGVIDLTQFPQKT